MNRTAREKLIEEWQAEACNEYTTQERRTLLNAASHALERSATMSPEEIQDQISYLSGKPGIVNEWMRQALQYSLAYDRKRL